MILETIEHKEYHKNGELWISGTIGIIAPLWKHLYDYRSEGQDGRVWCRLGTWAKHFDNGQLAWTLEYNEYGYSKNNSSPSYRKDGTGIMQ